ncbi:MAG TPA: EcsC family protein [Chryseosolibacter sp.]
MDYEDVVLTELVMWKRKMKRSPSLTNALAKKLQTRINTIIPEKIHKFFTEAIRNMTEAVCLGAEYTSPPPMGETTLEVREALVKERIKFYRNTATAEGAITGAGGILLGLADFPLWLALKMKMLFEIAALYGRDVSDYKERLFLLHIFELTFSSAKNRAQVFEKIENWEQYSRRLPDNVKSFDWRTFQQEYRDYIDLAKLLQLVPGIGAAVGAVVNHRLTEKLGNTAMNAFRLRLHDSLKLPGIP